MENIFRRLWMDDHTPILRFHEFMRSKPEVEDGFVLWGVVESGHDGSGLDPMQHLPESPPRCGHPVMEGEKHLVRTECISGIFSIHMRVDSGKPCVREKCKFAVALEMVIGNRDMGCLGFYESSFVFHVCDAVRNIGQNKGDPVFAEKFRNDCLFAAISACHSVLSDLKDIANA